MMTGYGFGDSSGSAWLMWGFAAIIVVAVVVLVVWAVTRSQRRNT
jgi:hypothetical protein